MSVNSRRQALKLCLDTMIIVIVQIGNQFLLKMFHRIEGLKIKQFALQQAEEIFHETIPTFV